jgi:hypothetical protein
MARRRIAWVVSLALMASGGLVAHTLAYQLAAAEASTGHAGAHADVHGYLTFWPICMAMCGTIVLVSLAALALTRAWSSRPVSPPLWLFTLLPPVGFVVQEHGERLLATGVFPSGAALEPTFALGLILQIPFALAAYFAARMLIAVAVAVARRLRGELRRRRGTREAAPPRPASICVVPISALALGYGERAPPLPAL